MVNKPSENEQSYFIEQEMKRLNQLRREHLEKMEQAERDQLKELHYLRCAKCGQKMETTTLVDVEIEICPDCRGIYLDVGELQKIIDEKNRGAFFGALTLARRVLRSGE